MPVNRDILKGALLRGIPAGLCTWLVYGLTFRMLIGDEPVRDALFSRDSFLFLGIATVAEIILYCVTFSRKAKK